MTARSSLRPIAIACAALLIVGGCVARERRNASEARARYEACVEEHSASHPECAAEREGMLEAQREYEDESKTRWGCHDATQPCPQNR